jgi:hypothetical protein
MVMLRTPNAHRAAVATLPKTLLQRASPVQFALF